MFKLFTAKRFLWIKRTNDSMLIVIANIVDQVEVNYMPYFEVTEYINQANYHQIKQHNIAYWTKGSGDSLLMIHGFPSAAWDWHHLWEPLSKGYQVIALDLLGFGLSDKPHPYKYSLLEQADIIEGLLKVLGIKSCHILAHDYGTSVAQELLARSAKDDALITLDSLCLLNGGLFAESHRPLLTQKLLKSPLGQVVAKLMSKRSLNKGFKKIFGADTPPIPHDIDVIWELLEHNNGKAVLHGLLTYIDERHVHRNHWVNAMQNTNVPMYFINGIQDPISGQHMLDQYNAIIPKPHSVGLNVGHYPQLEDSEAVLNLYSSFLLELSKR